MSTVSAYEAKTHLPRLIKAVEGGETIVITRHGKPVARLVPIEARDRGDVGDVIERMKRARARRPRVPLEELLAYRHEGHRY
jgi:prevent-host-death family protein